MTKYEIMLILDPNSKIDDAKELVKNIFKNKPSELKELENIQLAYEINKSKTGKYILILIEANGEEVNEFVRKSNISKIIWRCLVINLDSEKGLNRKANPKRVKRYVPRNRNQNNERPKSTSKTDEDDIKKVNE